MLGSTKWRPRGARFTASTDLETTPVSSVDAIGRAIPNAPVRGLLGNINLEGVFDSATNRGGHVITPTGTLIKPCVASIDWEKRSAWVAAGATIASVSRDLLVEGWVLEHLGGPSSMTVGGALALTTRGPYSHRTGLSDTLPTRIQFVDGRGERRKIARSGSDSSNLAAVIGALGLTGIPTAAQVAIRPVSSGWMLVDSRRSETFQATCEALLASQSEHYSYARIDPTAIGSGFGRGMVVTGRHAKVLELPAIRQPDALEYAPSTPVRAATVMPLKVNNVSGARALQALSHRTAPPLRRDQLVPISAFFHSVAEARVESKRAAGSITYEFVIPTDRAELIPHFLERLVQIGGTGDHATLQRCVKTVAGPLCASVDGWQFAIELVCDTPGLGRMLDEWDERVANERGQVVLGSDARMRPDVLAAMYPGVERWQRLRDELDPGRHFCSDLSRRLNL